MNFWLSLDKTWKTGLHRNKIATWCTKNVIFVLPPHQVKCKFFSVLYHGNVWLYGELYETAFLFEKMAPIVSELLEGSEDCLYLNVYTKATTAHLMMSFGMYFLFF
jgi:hypothetical protein